MDQEGNQGMELHWEGPVNSFDLRAFSFVVARQSAGHDERMVYFRRRSTGWVDPGPEPVGLTEASYRRYQIQHAYEDHRFYVGERIEEVFDRLRAMGINNYLLLTDPDGQPFLVNPRWVWTLSSVDKGLDVEPRSDGKKYTSLGIQQLTPGLGKCGFNGSFLALEDRQEVEEAWRLGLRRASRSAIDTDLMLPMPSRSRGLEESCLQ